MAADRSILFLPQTDLAIANAICHEIIRNDGVNTAFVGDHVSFHEGKTSIGYGLEDKFAFQDEPKTITFERYRDLLADYAPEKVEHLSGVPARELRYLASLYADPKRKVMSFWCMGFNQHTRGTWINNLVYNIHLLVGKIATPGNSPFSLTGQPSACGTVREVGTLTNRLPHGEVTEEEARKLAAEIWGVPVERIPAKPTYHTVEMFRALDRGDIRFLWVQVTNPMVTLPKLRRYRDGARKDDRFVVVSDVYPTPTTDVADVVLPAAMWIEREGMFGNSERRTQHFDKMLAPPGEAMSDTWQIIEVARRMGFEKLFPWSEATHIQEIWKEYSRFQAGPQHEMAPYEELKRQPGVMWPFVNGKETKWRYNGQYDPAAKGAFDFYGKPDRRAWIWFRPYEPPPESPDAQYPFWLNTGRVVEHWLDDAPDPGSPPGRARRLRGAASERRRPAQDQGRRPRATRDPPGHAGPARRDRWARPSRRGTGVRAVLRRGLSHQRADAGRLLPDLGPAGLQEVRGEGRARLNAPCVVRDRRASS
jgi:nitrate reductase NapA